MCRLCRVYSGRRLQLMSFPVGHLLSTKYHLRTPPSPSRIPSSAVTRSFSSTSFSLYTVFGVKTMAMRYHKALFNPYLLPWMNSQTPRSYIFSKRALTSLIYVGPARTRHSGNGPVATWPLSSSVSVPNDIRHRFKTSGILLFVRGKGKRRLGCPRRSRPLSLTSSRIITNIINADAPQT
ncbi:hypothetical protein OG21DRAFT_749277 [Imleria badia]|nr:hypothetical protein OG21DRAFT_749277 [Imleria badia]